MPDQRIIFAKEGKAKYISHLDLLHTLQRVFTRAKIHVRHSEGFNPHPKMSIALPLSVGHESVCEILDFALVDDIPLDYIPEKLNAVMPEGIRVISAYNAVRKIKDLSRLSVTGRMEYDAGLPENCIPRLNEFFGRDSIVISKRSKRGMSEVDIVPLIFELSFEPLDDNTITMHTVVSAQSPSLNPENLIAALRQLEPELAPDFVSFKRNEIYDANGKIFR